MDPESFSTPKRGALRRQRFSFAEIQSIVAMAAHGTVRSVCERHNISIATFYRWRSRVQRERALSGRSPRPCRLGRVQRERDDLDRKVRLLRAVLKEMLRTTALRRDAVQRLRVLGLSERGACDVLGFARSSMRYRCISNRSKPLV